MPENRQIHLPGAGVPASGDILSKLFVGGGAHVLGQHDDQHFQDHLFRVEFINKHVSRLS